MENFAHRLFTEDIQAVVDFLGHRMTYDKQIELEDFPVESRDEVQKLPTNLFGNSMIPNPNAVAYFGFLRRYWAYKVIATNDRMNVFYLTFMPDGRLASYHEILNYREASMLDKEWQVLLTRKYGKEYLEYVRQKRNAIHDAMEAEYRAKLYQYSQETEELINELSITAFPISNRK